MGRLPGAPGDAPGVDAAVAVVSVEVSADGKTVRLPPHRKSKMSSFTLPPEAAERLTELAKRLGIPKSRIVADLILEAPLPRKRGE
jgi:hypothetical protein